MTAQMKNKNVQLFTVIYPNREMTEEEKQQYERYLIQQQYNQDESQH